VSSSPQKYQIRVQTVIPTKLYHHFKTLAEKSSARAAAFAKDIPQTKRRSSKAEAMRIVKRLLIIKFIVHVKTKLHEQPLASEMLTLQLQQN
jgi:hypothetical protein